MKQLFKSDDAVKKYFNKHAQNYANNFDPKIIDQIISLIKISQTDSILEVGSGKSDFTKFLIESIGKKGRIYCLDLAEKMISLAKENIRDERVVFVSGDVRSHKLAGIFFDSIVCFNMFPHIVDKSLFFNIAYQRLKKGGELSICHDKTRRQIVSIHQRHHISQDISHFPQTVDIIKMITDNDFQLTHQQEQPFYFIQATKND